MNRQVNILGIIATILLFVNFVQAQPVVPQAPPPYPDTKQLNKIVADLSEQLSLSNEQETQIFNLFIAHFEKVKARLKSGRLSPKEMDALESKFEKEVTSRLSKKQQKLFTAYQKRIRQQTEPQPSANQWTRFY
ncbi:hypothetical protein [Mangrovibacterium sp.]|uniref:hypothetical protein n=1 Tax=Mangrovibacterium sp. TaxID=1961364 RepID=UPI003561DB95